MKGYKTYAVCAFAIVYAISGLLSGAFDANTTVEMVMMALGGAGLRSAIN